MFFLVDIVRTTILAYFKFVMIVLSDEVQKYIVFKRHDPKAKEYQIASGAPATPLQQQHDAKAAKSAKCASDGRTKGVSQCLHRITTFRCDRSQHVPWSSKKIDAYAPLLCPKGYIKTRGITSF